MDDFSSNGFENGSFKVLYVYSAPDLGTHEGLLKIGDATLHSDESLEDIIASSVKVDGESDFYTSEKIFEAAKNRVGEQTNTSGLRTKIEMAVLAVKRNVSNDGWETFRDHDFHNFLKRYGVEKVSPFEGSKAREWFRVDLGSVERFLKAFQTNSVPENVSEQRLQITLRPEQQAAVDKALESLKKSGRRGEPNIMLWACIMRFGKTLSAYELIKQHSSINKVLILTHRPAVLNGWATDFFKSGMDEENYLFGSRTLGNSWKLLKNSEKFVYFMSIQDGRGSFNEEEFSEELSEEFSEISTTCNGFGILETSHNSNSTEASNSAESSNSLESSESFEAEADELEESDSETIEKAADEEASRIFSKNSEIFETDWDLIIIDEGHEGFRTKLAEKTLSHLKRKYELHLSGTPYNISDRFSEEQTYRFDYSDEQKAKKRFAEDYPDEPSPYADRPEMEIYGYHLNQVRGYEDHIDEGTDRVNFSKLFATVPVKDAFGGETGDYDFVDKNIVFDLLDLISKNNRHSGDSRHFPFENVESKRRFAHTFWMVPNIPAAIALKKLLKEHNFFEDFRIVNATGDNWRKEFPHVHDSLSAVQKAIRENKKTITLSVGQLTTGVTVPEWTAVFMLNNTVSATNYMQTIFRSKSSGTLPDGRVKDKAFVFDFNPDRVLEIYQEIADSRSAEKKSNGDSRNISEIREAELTELLKGLPVMFTEDDRFKRVDFMQAQREIHRIQSAVVAQSGMDSDKIIDIPKLLSAFNADESDLIEYFKNLNGKVGARQKFKVPLVELNTGSNVPEVPEDSEDSEDSENFRSDVEGSDGDAGNDSDDDGGLTEEEKRLEKERKKAENDRRKNITAAKSTLRAVAIRLPFLIMALVFEKPSSEITLRNLPELVDDESWSEFMPAGFSKYGETEASWEFCQQFFDEAIFSGACERIQQRAIRSKTLRISERIPELVRIVGTFKNPDKETVLTPWRVVNLQMAKTLGGFRWVDDEGKWICADGEHLSDEELSETDRQITGEWVSNASNSSNSTGDSNSSNTSNSSETSRTSNSLRTSESLEKFWNSGSSLKIFEINSKTAQYPLYMAYSIFHKLTDGSVMNKTVEDMMWKTVVENCIFVNSRTPYAAKFAEVLLGGEKPGDVRVNTSVVDILKVREIFRKEKVKMSDEDWKVLWGWIFSPDEFSQASEKFEKILEISRSSEIQEISGNSGSFKNSENFVKTEVDSMDAVNDGGLLVTAKDRLLKVLEEARAFKNERDKAGAVDGEPVFDAVVSNPPYQIQAGGKSHQVYPEFYKVANDVGRFTSMIFPKGWQTSTGRASGSAYHLTMRSDKTMVSVDNYDETDDSPIVLFPGIGTSGISVVKNEYDFDNEGEVDFYEHGVFIEKRNMSEVKYWSDRTQEIFEKLEKWMEDNSADGMSGSVSPRGRHFPSSKVYTEEKYVDFISNSEKEGWIKTYGGTDESRRYGFFYVSPELEDLSLRKNTEFSYMKYKVIFGVAAGAETVWRKAFILPAGTVYTSAFIGVYFDSEIQAENFISYLKTLFYRFVLSESSYTINTYAVIHRFVPDLTTVTNPRTGKVGWESDWTDADLKEIFKNVLTDEDWFYIEETALKSDGGRK